MRAEAEDLQLNAAKAPEKKLIELGWEAPSPTFFKENIKKIEEQPFDGVTVHLSFDDGRASASIFTGYAFDEATFKKDAENLASVKSDTLTDNFIRINTRTIEGWDWFDDADWETVKENIRNYARTAQKAGFKGFLFDTEAYGRSPWKYSDLAAETGLSIDDYRAKVRERGREFMDIIQSEMSEAVIMPLISSRVFLDNDFRGSGANGDEKGVLDLAPEDIYASETDYGLVRDFMDGWLDVSKPNTRIIDGNESAYYYATDDDFDYNATLIREETGMYFSDDNGDKYIKQNPVGMSAYVDLALDLFKDPNDPNTERGEESFYKKRMPHSLSAEEQKQFLEHNVYHALRTTDEYAWLYSQDMSWWDEARTPAGAKEAVINARQKIENGETLQFGVDEGELGYKINPEDDRERLYDDKIVNVSAISDYFSIEKNETVELDVLANDGFDNAVSWRILGDAPRDREGDKPYKGSAEIVDGGTPEDISDDFIRFTPQEGFVGDAYVKYALSDGTGENRSTIRITVSDIGETTVQPAPTDDTNQPQESGENKMRIEAEALQLNGYRRETVDNSGASGDEYISLRKTGDEGIASGTFQGEAGTYRVSVGYYDEKDGNSAAEVTVDGNKQSFVLDENLPKGWAQPETLTSRVTHEAIALTPGAKFTLKGTRDKGEFARFDYIDFTPVETTEPPAPTQSPAPEAGEKLGTNIAGISDWSTQYPFTDFFKNARPWIPVAGGTFLPDETSKVNLDENGWVKAFSGNGLQYDEVSTFIPNPSKFDRYVVTYEGEGRLFFPDSGVIVDEAASSPGRAVIIAKGDTAIDMRLAKTGATGEDYIRNIKVVPEPFADLPPSQIFNPDFVKSLEGFKSLRFMDWMKTNFSVQSEWSDRPTPEYATFAGKKGEGGVPVEWMVELANQTGIDPWFNMPHQATDEYVRKFARYVKDNLDPELEAYVEYSNELWNGNFSQKTYATEQGKQLADVGSTTPWIAYHAQRSSEIGRIWDDEFGAQKDRSIGVLGASSSRPETSQQAIDYLKNKGLSLAEAGIDRLAIAPYFGGAVGSSANTAKLREWAKLPDGGLNNLFKELNEGGLLTDSKLGGVMSAVENQVKENAELAGRENIELIAYEGGQILTGYGQGNEDQAINDLLIAANADPRMGELYEEYFQIWDEQGGDLFVHFTDVTKPGKWGSFGAKEDLYQQSSPKWEVLQKIIEEQNLLNGEEPASPVANAPAEDNSFLIDLSAVDLDGNGIVDEQVGLAFSDVSSNAGYNNTVGFYVVEDKAGTVVDETTGARIKPGELGYTKAALGQRLQNTALNRNSADTVTKVEGNQLLAPYLIANGTAEQFLARNASNQRGNINAYAAYAAANPDGFAHVQGTITEGTTGQLTFEDLWGGGDKNFADFAVSVDVTAPG